MSGMANIMSWSQQSLPMDRQSDSVQLVAMEKDPRSQLLSSFSGQSGQLNPSHTFASTDSQQISVRTNDGSPEVLGLSSLENLPIHEARTDKLTPSNQCSTTDSTLSSHQISERAKQTIHKEPWPKVITLERKPLLSTQKDTSQHKHQNPSSGILRLQKSSSKIKRTVHAEPSPKVGIDSFVSVRIKMRESLAAALALVCKDQQLTVAVDASEKMPINDAQNVESEGARESPSMDVSSNVLLTKNVVMKDDLLLQNGLSWSSSSDADECKEDSRETKRVKLASDTSINEAASKNPLTLATEIEGELFNLFGGVNKKYKEKGRSLLFNLRDQNNPELRKHVFWGEITPQRLCSMTVDELASKELSEWRIAKAEELAHMVVLPDSDIDLRRLVKKTHKGDVQVEVERDDRVSVEVAIGANFLSHSPKESTKKGLGSSRSNGKVGQPKNSETKSSTTLALSGTTFSEENSLESLLQDNTDFMQDIMVAEYKDSESLPPVPTLDEFMRDLDSQPPFEDLSMVAFQENGLSENNLDSSKTKLDAEIVISELQPGFPETTTVSKSIHNVDHADSKLNDTSANMITKCDPIITASGKLSVPTGSPLVDSSCLDSQPVTSFGLKDRVTQTKPSAHRVEHVWDGLIQLTVSSLVTVFGFYKSGEQTSIKDWPTFLEIKGRVRLDAFEKFLQELNTSQSRGVMVLQFLWKEGSPESGRVKLNETIDSYIADEKVGFAEPTSGVEIYFCPAHPKTSQLLMQNLPKEHGNAPKFVNDGLIGIVIWRRPITRTAADNEKRVSRKTPNLDVDRLSSSFHGITNPTVEEDLADDVPPGFGPVPARNDDDLPEFDFVQGSTNRVSSSRFNSSTMVGPGMSAEVWSPQSSPVRPDFPPRIWSPVTLPVGQDRPDLPPVRPPPLESQSIDHLRQLIQKYGQDESRNEPGTRTGRRSEDDEDDIPEWCQNKLGHFQHQRTPYPHASHHHHHHHNTLNHPHPLPQTHPPLKPFTPRLGGQFPQQHTENRMRTGAYLRRR